MDIPASHRPLEIWGGVECTVNRVADRTHDQFAHNGHGARLDDFDRFADLGIRTLRTSALWERVAPDGLASADWAWTDAALARMQHVGIAPIAGLVHHGSGPRSTSLIDPGFPAGLATFARAVAERYPHVEAYTPVNEPLTTARFSGLYGHWYPHGRNARTFARALVTQIQATVEAMRAIREVNPAARLVQTEDLGRTWSTPGLVAQAEMENERRWLTWDLLTGHVRRDHPMWKSLVRWGIAEYELDRLAEAPCPPDIVGVNHYVTSERFIDDRIECYPGCVGYADVEAVRVLSTEPAGLATLLAEAGRRYGLPLAVTEAHLGCTREEQVRWLAEVWRAAEVAREAGADVRAVTAWALLGSFDWDCLLTECRGRYEPGVFDVRSTPPRPTALAGVVRALAAGREADHPVLDGPGWWRRPFRLTHPPAEAHGPVERLDVPAVRRGAPADARPILIVGADLPLGVAAVQLCGVRGLAVRTLARAEAGALAAALAQWQPWAVVDALAGG
ncbi:MAG TPA: family 1 glycosylhydrolase, partial [Rubricoccaceae bacterium]